MKKIVKPANILEPGQGGGRPGRCVRINMQKVHFIQQEARRQGKRIYRVGIDFKNAFNDMSQAALWQVKRMFKIPDVMMMIAFITTQSSLVPLIEGLCAQIYFRFEISVVCSHLLLFSFVKEKTC